MIFLAVFPTDLKHDCLMFLILAHHHSLIGLFTIYATICTSLSTDDSFHASAYRARQRSSSSEGSKRTRTGWTTEETSVLLEIWGALYETLKSASTAQKKSIWGQILKTFLSKCRDLGLSTNKILDQIKKRIKHLEYEYLCKFNKHTTVAIVAMLRLLGLILIYKGLIAKIVRDSS